MLKLNINKFCIGTKRRTNKQANKQRKKLKPMHHGRIKKRKPFDFVPRLIRFTQPTYNALIIIVKKCKHDFYFLFFFIFTAIVENAFIYIKYQSLHTIIPASTLGGLYKRRKNAAFFMLDCFDSTF